VRKEWWRLMSPQKSGDEVHETVLKKRGQKEPQKMRDKERRGNVTILFPHLCFRVAPCCKESNLGYSMIYMKVFIISFLIAYPLWTNLITRANCHYYLLDTQKDFGEA
jgi:hypothetical protein